MRIAIEHAGDPRLAPYRLTREPLLLKHEGLFVAESRRVVRTLVEESPYEPVSVLATPTAYDALALTWEALDARVPIYVAERALVSSLVGFDVHRGCLALARAKEPIGAKDLIASATASAPLVVLEAVTDPDNVGSIFRSARGFGAAGVLLSPTCASPLYRKAIRTSLGASLLVPFATMEAWPDGLFDALSEANIRSVALTPQAQASPLGEVAEALAYDKVALLTGTEGDGLASETIAGCSVRARIPMAAGADSLNAAVATAVALYRFSEASRPPARA